MGEMKLLAHSNHTFPRVSTCVVYRIRFNIVWEPFWRTSKEKEDGRGWIRCDMPMYTGSTVKKWERQRLCFLCSVLLHAPKVEINQRELSVCSVPGTVRDSGAEEPWHVDITQHGPGSLASWAGSLDSIPVLFLQRSRTFNPLSS